MSIRKSEIPGWSCQYWAISGQFDMLYLHVFCWWLSVPPWRDWSRSIVLIKGSNWMESIHEVGKAKAKYFGKIYLKVERRIYLGAPAGYWKSPQTVILRSPGFGGTTKNLVNRWYYQRRDSSHLTGSKFVHPILFFQFSHVPFVARIQKIPVIGIDRLVNVQHPDSMSTHLL